MKRVIILPVFIIIVLLGLGPVQGASTYQVPTDFPDIYTAINSVPPGSVIEVSGVQLITMPVVVFKDLKIVGGVYIPIDGYEVFYDPIFVVSGANLTMVGVRIIDDDVVDPYKLVGIHVMSGRLELIQSNITLPITDILFPGGGRGSSIFANTGIFATGGTTNVYSSFIKAEIAVMIGSTPSPPSDPIKVFPIGEERVEPGKGKQYTEIIISPTREISIPGEARKEEVVRTAVAWLESSRVAAQPMPQFPTPSQVSLNNPIHVNVYGSLFVADVGYYISSTLESPVLKSQSNLMLAEMGVYAAFSPFAPYDIPITSLLIEVIRDRIYSWSGGGGIAFTYPGISSVVAGANMYVRFAGVEASGQGFGHLMVVGIRLGRIGGATNFYYYIDGGNYQLSNSPFFLGAQTRYTLSPLYIVLNNLDVVNEGDTEWSNKFAWIITDRSSLGLDMYVRNVVEEGYIEGIRLDTRDYIKYLRVFGLGYFHWERSGPGLVMNVLLGWANNPLGSDPKSFLEMISEPVEGEGLNELISYLAERDDVVFLYSILWSIWLNSFDERNGLGVSLIETVYVQSTESILRNAWINSIWTLETLVLSQYTDTPIQGASVLYTHAGMLKSSGVTGPAGSYTSTFIHRVDRSSYIPLNIFSIQSSFISPLRVDAKFQGASAGTWYIPYVGDDITLPNWFGRIVLRLPVLAVRVLGFSHDMGTTYLEILGYKGGFAGFYSYTPDELGDIRGEEPQQQGQVSPASGFWNQTRTGYRYYDLRIIKVAYSPSYIRIDAMILYEGFWQPTVIYINTIERLVWSPGPVDFRGWY